MITRHLFLMAAGLCLAFEAGAEGVERRTANDGQVVLENVPEVPAELRQRLNRYLNTRGAGVRDWTEDGRGLYVSTRFGNVYQLHRVDQPGGARHQLTFFEEPVGGARRRPGSRQLSFTMDAGGNEVTQIHLFDPETGDHRMISDGLSRHRSPRWSPDGEWLAFQSTRRDDRSNDVWVMDPEEPESARLVVESPDGTWWGPMDWSADGGRLLIANYVSIADSRIHLLDLASGELTLVAGDPESPVSVLGAGGWFDGDDRGPVLRHRRGRRLPAARPPGPGQRRAHPHHRRHPLGRGRLRAQRRRGAGGLRGQRGGPLPPLPARPARASSTGRWRACPSAWWAVSTSVPTVRGWP